MNTMSPDAEKFLFSLLSTPSPTGFEMPGQRVWATYVKKWADKVECDAYGNTYATFAGTSKKGPTLMLATHADEIGYMIKQITSEGFLRLERLGGSDCATARGRRLTIYGDHGPVRGLIGNTAIHIRDRNGGEKAPEIHELYVDVGATSARQVAELGLRVGHPAVYADTAEKLGSQLITGRALDNRLGGFITAQVLRALASAKKRPSATIVLVNAIQEEIGGHGAVMITQRLQPDLCLCLDVTHATDTPGIEKAKHGDVKLGGGPAITHGGANHPLIVQRLIHTAKKKKITLQHEASGRYTGTDTDKIFTVGGGVPSALVSLPLRYMHSVVELASLVDVNAVINLLIAFSSSLQPGETFTQKL